MSTSWTLDGSYKCVNAMERQVIVCVIPDICGESRTIKSNQRSIVDSTQVVDVAERVDMFR